MTSPGSNRLPPLVWVFPLVLLIVLSLTANRVSEEQLRQQLLDAWGVEEAQLDKLGLALDGLEVTGRNLRSLQPEAPHEHSLNPSLSIQPTGISIIFPHFGDGEIGGGRKFQTTWILSNFTAPDSTATGFFEIYAPSGDPQQLTVNGSTASVFEFSLQANQVQRFTSSGEGVVKVGWVHVHSDQRIGGTSIFGIRDQDNGVVTDVGVGASDLGEEFTIFADTIGDSTTGVAVVNPDDTNPLSLSLELHDTDGNLVATVPQQLGPRGHFARFLPEIFTGVAGIQEFEGSVLIRSVAAPELAIAESMRPPTRTNYDSAANAKPFTAGQELPPPRNLSIQPGAQDRLVLSWQLPEPPSGGGESEEFVDETEPNDFDSPDALEIGQTARGTIDPDSDRDVWRFEGTAGQNIVIDVEAESKGSDLDSVVVLSPDRDLDQDGFPDENIGFNDDFENSLDSRLEALLPETGGYVIQIFDSFEEGPPSFFYEMRFSLATTAGPTLQGFNIYRSLAPASPQVDPTDRIASVGAEVTTFTDASVQQSSTYRYVVTAVYDQGESPPSNPVETTTPGPTEAGPPFAGITLRSTGDTLTSVPFVPPPPAESEVTRLALAHVGDGTGGGLQIKTSAILFNNTGAAATATLEFFKSDGTPMVVSIGEETASSFEVDLSPGGVKRLVTSGGGGIKTGWARVTMDRHLAGSAIFSLFDTGAELVSEVGVRADSLVELANIIVDSSSTFNTGVALAFPVSDTPADQRIFLSLQERSRRLRGRHRTDLECLSAQCPVCYRAVSRC